MWSAIVVLVATTTGIISALPATSVHASTSHPRFPTPSVSTGPKDPCGPVVQDVLDPTIPNDTCTAKISFSPSPATYGASLLNDGSGLDINYYNCYPVILDVCAALTDPRTPRGAWNWTDVGSECVMGFWLPEYAGAAPIKTVDACEKQVFTPMYKIGRNMGGTAYNQVVVNLRVLPDDTQTGQQVSAGYPSYTITYLPLIKGNETWTPA